MQTLFPIPHLSVSAEQIAAFCQAWGIVELSVFGSVLRDDFTDESDVDVLYVLPEDVNVGFKWVFDAEQALSELLGRKVDFVSKKAVQSSKNWIRRNAILNGARVIYVA
jgi:hypothetical protein